MANYDEKNGFIAVKTASGHVPCPSNYPYTVADSVTLMPNEVVSIVDSGDSIVIQRAAASDNGKILGVMCAPTKPGINYISATETTRTVTVYTDPSIQYRAQFDDGAGGAEYPAADVIGCSVDMVGTAGTTKEGKDGIVFGYAQDELDTSSILPTNGTAVSTGNVKIVAWDPADDNIHDGTANAKWAKAIVQINEGVMAAATLSTARTA